MKGNELTKAAFELLESAPINLLAMWRHAMCLYATVMCSYVTALPAILCSKRWKARQARYSKRFAMHFTSSLLTKLAAAIMKSKLRQLRSKMDYTEHGGAPLLGVNGLVVKCHGSSDVKAVKSAVRQAKLAIESKLISSISAEISRK